VKLTRPVIGNANPISLDDRSDSSDESTQWAGLLAAVELLNR